MRSLIVYGTFNYWIIQVYNDFAVCALYLAVLLCAGQKRGRRREGMEIPKAGVLYVPVPFQCLCGSVLIHEKPRFAEILSGAGAVLCRGAGILWDFL